MRIRGTDWAVLAGFVVGFHILGTALVRYFYSYHIAHYDSVGGLIQALETLQVYHNQGYAAGVAEAWNKAPLSISQNMFSALLAPYVDPSPQGIQLYNTLACSVAAVGMLVLLRRFEAGALAIGLGLVSILLGDALYWWDLGAFDFRRDFGMYAFMCGALFLGTTYFVGALRMRGEILLGLAFGIAMGLTLVCRDSAPLLMMGVVVAPLTALWVFVAVRDGWITQIRKLAWPLIGFSPFAIVFFLKLGDLLARIANPLTMYGISPNGSDSLVGNARRVPDAVLGLFGYPFNKAPLISTVLVLLTLLTLGFLCWRAMRSKAQEAPSSESQQGMQVQEPGGDQHVVARRAVVFLLATAVWVPIFLHLFFSLVLKWASDQPPIVAMAPYLLVLVGVTAAIAAGIIYSRNQIPHGAGRFIVSALILAMIVAAPARALTRMPVYPPGTYTQHLQYTRLTNAQGGAAVIATLTDNTGLMRAPAIQLMSLQLGLPQPEILKFRTDDGGTLDLQIGIPPEPEVRESLLAAMDRAIRCKADFIVVDKDPAAYTKPEKRLLLYGFGDKLASGLLADLGDKVMRSLDQNGQIVLIDNRMRSGCAADGGQ